MDLFLYVVQLDLVEFFKKKFYKHTVENRTNHVPCNFFVKKPLPSVIFNLIQCLQLHQFKISVFFVVCLWPVSVDKETECTSP